MRSELKNTLVLIFALTLVGVPLRAQTGQGVVTGTILDAQGAVIPRAEVTLTNEGTNISETRTTGTDGLYRFPLVPPGTYTVTVTASNFEKSITRGHRG